MIVLKIIGWILLAVIGLIILLLSVKVKIFAEYSDANTNLRLQWLFIKIPIYPTEKKEKKPKEKKPEEEKDEAPSEPKEKKDNNFLQLLYDAHGVDGLVLIVKRLFSYIGTFFGDLMNALVIDDLYIDVMCNKGDAASTAIYYGEVCSALFPLLGALVTKYKVKKYDINVYPDYIAKHSSANYVVSMHLYPIYLIGITLAFVFRLIFKVVFRLIFKVVKHQKSNDNSVKNSDKTESVA